MAYLDSQAVADRYHTSPGALYAQRYRGNAPGSLACKVGRRLLWRERDLEEWFDEQLALEASTRAAGRV